MKNKLKAILTLLLALTLLFCSCSSGGGKEETEKPTESTSVAEGISENATVKIWVSEPFNKVHQTQRAPAKLPKEISVQMAANEKESAQVTVRVSENASGLKIIKTEGNATGITVELFEEQYIKTGTTNYPDPITPLTESFDVMQNKNKSILIRFVSSPDAAAGDYTYTFEIRDGADKLVETVTVSLTVWGFALPESPKCPTAGHLSIENISRYERISVVAAKHRYKEYYDMLLDYGFCAHTLPYDILDDKADAYMSDPRVTAFRIDHYYEGEKLAKIYEKLSSNPEWLEKAYFYVYDEPTTVEALNTLKDIVTKVRTYCPEVRTLTAFFTNIKVDGVDELDFLAEYIDVLCAKSAAWDEGWLSDPLSEGYFGDRMKALREEGHESWWYVCWEPGEPYGNLFVDEDGLNHRALFWQQYYNNVDGFLYWLVNNWTTADPCAESHYSDPPGGRVYGDGVLMYPGKTLGVDGPVASVRLECLRDGIEDYTMLKLAEEKLGHEWVNALVESIGGKVDSGTDDGTLFLSVRKQIGEALSQE